jgi:hypothetical protein
MAVLRSVSRSCPVFVGESAGVDEAFGFVEGLAGVGGVFGFVGGLAGVGEVFGFDPACLLVST